MQNQVKFLKLIKPSLLKKLIQHDQSMTFAVDMLTSRWNDVIAKYGPQTKIQALTVILARDLVKYGLFTSQIDFNNYGNVKTYLLHNDIYMSASGKQEMLKPFQE